MNTERKYMRAVERLNDEFQRAFTSSEREKAEFFPDEVTNKAYIWKFKIDDRIITLEYYFRTKMVVRCYH